MKIYFFVLVLIFIIGCRKSGNLQVNKNLTTDTTTKAIVSKPAKVVKDIKYRVVVDKGTFSYRLSNGETGVSTVKYIVVSKKSTQAEVRKLAEKLWSKYQSSDMILIPILTSMTAAKNFDNDNYDISGSWLLLITKNYAQNTIQYKDAFYNLKGE
jgi:hypothetical protein